MFSVATGSIGVALYVAATVQMVLGLRRGKGPRHGQAIALGAAALVFHGVVLSRALFIPGGLDLGFFHALSLAAAVVVLLMLVMSLTEPVDNLGIGLFPLAAVALAAAVAFAASGRGPTIPTSAEGLDLHILFSIAAYGVLSLAAMQAILLWVQHRLLHDHHPVGAVRALPPLYVMESLLFRMIGVGFVLLTIALATGFYYLEDMFAQHLVHKTVLSLIAWAVFAVLLAGHHFAGWRGPTAARFTLGGVVLLILGYFGSKLVLELILARP